MKEIAYLSQNKKHLTFNMGRHTFASSVTVTKGVPLESVSKLLGHTKLTATQIYPGVTEKKVSEGIELLRAKMFSQSSVEEYE